MPREDPENALPQQSSPASREEEGHWVAMEDRRRRSIAFEKMSKRMLRYLDNSDDVKVGLTELLERLDISHSASGPSSDERKWPSQKSKFSGKEKKSYVLLVWPVERTAGRSGGVGKKVSKYDAGGPSIE